MTAYADWLNSLVFIMEDNLGKPIVLLEMSCALCYRRNKKKMNLNLPNIPNVKIEKKIYKNTKMLCLTVLIQLFPCEHLKNYMLKML